MINMIVMVMCERHIVISRNNLQVRSVYWIEMYRLRWLRGCIFIFSYLYASIHIDVGIGGIGMGCQPPIKSGGGGAEVCFNTPTFGQ